MNIRKAGLYVKRKKATCVTHEKKESLGTILAEKILGFDLRISCQFQPIERNKEMSLFDLQTVGFWDSKNATLIAEIVTIGVTPCGFEIL